MQLTFDQYYEALNAQVPYLSEVLPKPYYLSLIDHKVTVNTESGKRALKREDLLLLINRQVKLNLKPAFSVSSKLLWNTALAKFTAKPKAFREITRTAQYIELESLDIPTIVVQTKFTKPGKNHIECEVLVCDEFSVVNASEFVELTLPLDYDIYGLANLGMVNYIN